MKYGIALCVGAILLGVAGAVATAQLPDRAGGARPGALEQRPPRRSAGGEPARISPEELIRRCDRDGDGRISRREAPERMQQRFDAIDTDHDGCITLAELKARDARVDGRGGPGGRAPLGPGGGAQGRGPTFRPAGNFTVITLGTGSPRYNPERSGPSALIQYQGRYYLVDMGNGAQARLNDAGITVRQIGALLLTHHHLDHNEEFIPLFIHTRLAGGAPEIIGPPGTRKLVDFIKEFYAEDIAYRLRRGGKSPADFAPSAVRELQGGESFPLGGMTVRTAPVKHTIPTVAYRFDAGGQSIVISGDLYYSESLVTLAHDADVLVIDSGGAVARKGAPGGPNGGGPGLMERAGGGEGGVRSHSTMQEVIAMAQQAGVKRLVLTHIAPGEVDEQATIRALGQGYHGEVIVGRDLLEVSPALPAGGQTRAEPGNARVYVDGGRSTAQRDGKSWATAFATAQEGIDAAAALGGGEVWVAQGTYRPTNGIDRSASIRLRAGVALYGGFIGSETRRELRDWERHATVLSGDIGRAGANTDNSYHVVTGADAAVLDGFTITGGYGLDAGGPGPMGGPGSGPGPMGGPGGGFGPMGRPGGGPPIHTSPEAVLSGASPGSGAGLLNFQCAPTIRNCTFSDNHGGKGGAMYNMASRSFPPREDASTPMPLVVNCTFRDNSARGRGGAVANDLGTSPTFRGCTFQGNRCDGKGGAVYNDFGCSPALVNCLFFGNRAVSAGAVGNDGGSSPLLLHCTFTRNVAEEEGAALYQGTGPANNPTVVGCIFWDDRCENGPAEIFNWHDNDPQVIGSCVRSGYPGKGNTDQDPRFIDPARGDYRPAAASPCAGMGHAAATPEELLQRYANRTQPARERPRPPLVKPPAWGAGVGARVLYVNAANPAGTGDGASWGTAFRSLQAALAAAAEQPTELWVAAGTYQPTDGTDRAATFRLSEKIALYGGFGGGETRREERDWKAHATVLSGDIGRAGDASDNSYHVVTGADDTVLDGFVIRDGNADGRTYDGKGGGMVNYQRAPQTGPMGQATGFSPVARNCTFTHNRAREGGAVYDYDRGAPQFIHCRFVENSAEYGGAMVDRVGVRSVLVGCEFERNTARWRAGALYLDYGARPCLTECRFTANRCERNGGALATASRASQLENTIPLLRACSFTGNTAGNRGGAIANSDSSLLGLDGCTFSGNRAGAGGALSNDFRARAVVLDCRFANNRSERGEPDIACDESSGVSRNRGEWPAQTPRMPLPMGFGPG